ncbi:reverse transcriptase domain-containing protein [Tanacetum coccineum]
MTKKDEEKTAFHTEEGVFCYTKIPFGLKNARATYQRLVDSAFKEQIGDVDNLERKHENSRPRNVHIAMEEGRKANEAVSCVAPHERNGEANSIHYVRTPIFAKWTKTKLCSNEEANSGPSRTCGLWALRRAALRVVKCSYLAHNSGTKSEADTGHKQLELTVTGHYRWVVSPRLKCWVALGSQPRYRASSQSTTSRCMKRWKIIPEPSNARGDLTPSPKAWRLYTDGASNNEGFGAGLILIAPNDVEYSYALRLNFSNSNNEAEYEALLAGLRIAKEMQVKDIHSFVNSKLVASQVEGSYEAKGESIIKYQEKVLELAGAFNRFRITHIPRAENRKADALSKLAVVQFDHLSIEVLVEVLNERSVEAQEKGKLPEDPVDARTLMEKIGNYTMEDGVLYRKSYLVPLMRDARELIRACDDCQAHASIPRLPKADMISVTSAWPFMKWGMDIVGPLLEGPGRVKYLIVAIDYFTKWMEAKPLATITGKQVVNFTYDNIVCRFGIPATIITDNGTRFGNGAVERANKSLLRGIKTRLEKGGPAWAEEVPNVLWAHQTMKKTNNGETPFSLTYDTEAVIPAEIGMPTHRTSSVNEKTNDQEFRLNLDLLDERREIVAIREARYKQQVEKHYNKKVRHVQFKVGEFVLKRNEVSRATNTGKLGPTWEGPYKVIQAFQSEAYKLSNMEGEEIPRTWHACNLRRHMGLPHALAHGLQPESCCGKTGPCWLNRPDPYKSRCLSDK